MGSVLWIPIAFACATYTLYWVSLNLPDLSKYSKETNTALTFPSSLEELSAITTLLNVYKANHFQHVLLLFCIAYLYKQTFAIPGSVFMNVLAGAIFGLKLAFPLTCVLTACGATCCYLLSNFFGKSYVIRFFPDKVKTVQEKVAENSDGLFFFLLFLRLFPMSPNWFMNIVAPILNIPVHLFFLSVLVGLMPYNFVCVQTGCLLSQVTSISDIFTLSSSLKMAGIACSALVPGLLLRKFRSSKKSAD